MGKMEVSMESENFWGWRVGENLGRIMMLKGFYEYFFYLYLGI